MGKKAGSLYTCDLICYGAASPGIFQSFCSMLENRSGKQLESYAHRGHGIIEGGDEKALYTDGAVEAGTVRSRVWKRLWFKFLCRESCFRCAHHSIKRPGNLTIGDFWGMKRGACFQDDRWGTSCVIANDGNGLELLRSMAPRVRLAECSLGEIANARQPMLKHPPARNGRDVFWSSLYAIGFEGACRKTGVLGSRRKIKDVMKLALSASHKNDDKRGEGVDKRLPIIDFDGLVAQNNYPVAFAARNLDDTVRRMSSSGGMFHALASCVIDDFGGVVYGCAFDKSMRAVHIRCETMAEAERCMGSKYSQSDMGDSIRMVRKDLDAGRTVLFTGTPCQVAAVRAVCAGVQGGVLY